MNKIQYSFLLALLTIAAQACSSNEPGAQELQNDEMTQQPDYYYWYHGKKIEIQSLKDVCFVSSDGNIDEILKNDYVIDVTDIVFKSDKETSRTLSNEKSNWRIVSFKDSSRSSDLLNTLSDNEDIHIAPVFGNSIETCIPTSEIFYVKSLKSERAKMIEFAKAHDVEVIKEFMPDWFILKAPSSSNGLQMSNLFYESNVVADVDPAFMFDYQPSAIPAEPMINKQNYLDPINAFTAWDISKGSSDVVIAVIDTGVDRWHNEICNNITSDSYDFMHSTHDVYIYSEHATQVAGLIAANHNGMMIAGIAPNVTIMSIGVNMSDTYRPYTPCNLAASINYAANHGADVINCSWGDHGGDLGEFKNEYESKVMEEAIANALTNGREGKGAVVVFAAGNTNKEVVDYPASCNDDLLVVGSVDPNLLKSYFTNYGTKIDVVTIGENVLTIAPYQNTSTITGTSACAPQVSAAAALILSINPNLTGKEVRDVIESTATHINASKKDFPSIKDLLLNNTKGENGWRNGVYGYGLLNLYSAVTKAQESLN